MTDDRARHAEQMCEFARLWARDQANVSAYVRAAIRDAHDAEDVLQQTAAAAAEDFEQFDRSRSFAGWTIGIARFRILQYRQRRTREQHLFDDSTLRVLAEAQTELSIEADDRREALRKCMDSLQPRGRKVIEMRYTRLLKPAAIAEQIGASANAVSIMLHRVRKALATCITRELQSMERRS